MDAMTQYLQAAAFLLGAIWNAIMAYEAYPKVWKTLLSALVALLLLVMAFGKLFPNP